ncbi:MAG TPA: CpaD family pilus assembly protein [Caulobacteraceae bacterium]
MTFATYPARTGKTPAMTSRKVRLRSASAGSVVALVAALALCACASRVAEDAGGPLTPTEHYAIKVASQPVQLALEAHRQGMSPNQARALDKFAQGWIEANGGEITLRSPAHGGDPAAAYRTVADAHDLLVAHGVAPSSLRIVGYDAQGDHRAPVLIDYAHYVAKGPSCGHLWENLSANGSNRAYANFGCALTANVAAEIADPGDLIAPRQSDPVDAERRQIVLDHYRKGDVTSSAKDDQANGAVSTAVH